MSTFSEKPYPARYWIPLKNQKLECQLCPRYCRLQPGQRGFCFVRQNIDGELILTTYGRSSGFCIDPIEKKPLNHFYPGTSVLSFGTAGCNLGCKFCQNWSISKSREFDSLSDQATPETIVKAAKFYNCQSIAFTYNDPVIFAEYAMDIADECRKEGIKTVAVTAGYISETARPDFFSKMDAANVDLKAFSENFYQKITLSHIQPVLDTLIYLKKETQVWFEITNLLIPGENNSIAELQKMCTWILKNLGDSVPLHFTAFHPDFKMRNKTSTPQATLTKAREEALKMGLKFVYTGNVHDPTGSSTYCAQCAALLIERDWFEIGTYKFIDQNRCPHCHSKCPGHFSEKPGDWGSRRLPVFLKDFK